MVGKVGKSNVTHPIHPFPLVRFHYSGYKLSEAEPMFQCSLLTFFDPYAFYSPVKLAKPGKAIKQLPGHLKGRM